MSSIHPNLVSGAQWARVKDGTPVISTVLCVSNAELKRDLQKQFPPQVVVLSHTGKILNHPVDAFIERRTFVGMDDFIAARFKELLAGEEDQPSDDDEISIDDTDVGVDPAFAALLGSASDEASVQEVPLDGSDMQTEEEVIPVFLPADHDGLSLNEHFLGYSGAPFAAPGGDTQHTLRFLLDNTLNIDQVESVFNPKVATSPTLHDFVVDSHADRIELQGYVYRGTFLEVDSMGNGVAAVYLTTNAHPVEETAAVQQPPVTIIPEAAQQSMAALRTEAPTHVIPQLNQLPASTAQTVVVTA